MKSARTLYKEIEAKHGFELPKEYISLCDQGCMEHGEPGHYTDLITSRYLWVPEMEWITLANVLSNSRMPSYSMPGLISFAFTGGDDNWCLYPPATIAGKMPVVECPRDDRCGKFFAPDFSTAVYRQILTRCLLGFGTDEENPVDRAYLVRYLKQLGPQLPAAAAATLEWLATAPVQNVLVGKSNIPTPALINPQQFEETITRDLSFSRLNEQIVWMED